MSLVNNIHASASLRELLVKSGVPMWQPQRLRMAVLFHNSRQNFYIKPSVVDHSKAFDVVKLLVDNMNATNDTVGQTNLMHVIFYHVQEVFFKIYIDKKSVADVDQSWNGLIEASKLIVEAGLKIRAEDIFKTFRLNLQVVSSRSPDKDVPRYITAISSALSKAFELLTLFWPETECESNSAILDVVWVTIKDIISKLRDKANPDEYDKFCSDIAELIFKLYVSVPSKPLSVTAPTFLDIFGKSETQSEHQLLFLFLCFTPISRIHLLTSLPKHLTSNRVSLQTQAKLSVLKVLPFPKADCIEKLPIPFGMKENFLLGP